MSTLQLILLSLVYCKTMSVFDQALFVMYLCMTLNSPKDLYVRAVVEAGFVSDILIFQQAVRESFCCCYKM